MTHPHVLANPTTECADSYSQAVAVPSCDDTSYPRTVHARSSQMDSVTVWSTQGKLLWFSPGLYEKR